MESCFAFKCPITFRIAALFVAILLIHHSAANSSSSTQHSYTTSHPQAFKNDETLISSFLSDVKTANASLKYEDEIEAVSENIRELQHPVVVDDLFIQSTANQTDDESDTGKDLTPNVVTSAASVILTEDYTTEKIPEEIFEQFTVYDDSLNTEDTTARIGTEHSQTDIDITPHHDEPIKPQESIKTDEILSVSQDISTTLEKDKTFETVLFVDKKPNDDTANQSDYTTKQIDRTSRHDGEFNRDETTIFQYWTTLSSDVPLNENTERPKETKKDKIKPTNLIHIIKDNTQITGHLVTEPSVNMNNLGNKKNNEVNELKLSEVNNTILNYLNKYKINSSFGFINDSTDPRNISETSLKLNTNDVSGKLHLNENSILAKTGEDLDLDSISTESLVKFKHANSSVGEELANYQNKTSSQEDKDILEAIDYGLNEMEQLYGVREPMLYHLGLWLEPDNPARYVATFNWQSEEARNLSMYGYAALQASMHLKEKFPDELESRISSEDDEQDDDDNDEVQSRIRPLRPLHSPLRQRCPLRGEPRCPPASKRYRTHDGTCNNARRPRWGSALSAVQRFLPAEYADGVQEPRLGRAGGRLPSARAVSEAVHWARGEQGARDAPVTHMLMQWGQFLDHDVTSSSQARGFNGSVPRCCGDGGREFMPRVLLHPECLPIPVHETDPFYGPQGIRCLEFLRSSPAPRAGCELGYREQMNQVTAYIDASPVYGSSARQSDKLRIFRNGLLQYGRVQTRRPILPPEASDVETLCRGGALDSSCFKAGDGRVNEHPGLVAMHIVWLRKHNRMATELSHINPHWSDEKVYQETRKIIGAFVQHITYREFLPIVLGSEVLRLFDLNLLKKGYFKGYSSKVNPNPANAFGAAAFRFGHSLVQDSFMRYDRFHRPIPNNVSLHEEQTNPSNIWSLGAVDRLILGLSNQPSQKRDEFLSPELTNHLFQTSRFTFGMDLASINIQRGRDHGIPAYVNWREPCGLSPVDVWSDLLKIMPLRAVRRIQDVYLDVEDVDLFTGGMAERPVVGGLVGPTFACIIAQQFSNLRRGDRFWYENGEFHSSFTPAQLQQIRKITLAQVLCQTMENVDTLQPFVFLSPDEFRNERVPCDSFLLNNFDLSPWTEHDFDNNINSFDRTTRSKPTTKQPHITQQTFTNLLSDVLSNINKKTTLKNKLTVTPESIKIDDKLDLPKKTTPSSKPTTLSQFTRTKIPSKPMFTRQTVQTTSTLPTTSIKLDDKLDFLSKSLLSAKDANSPTQTNNHSQNRRSLNDDDSLQNTKTYDTPDTVDGNMTNVSSAAKTYGTSLTDGFPFFSNLFNRQTTPRPLRPVLRPHITIYQEDYQSTERPDKFTYLINIVPKTTSPRYDNQKETIKITVQGQQSHSSNPTYPFNKRPIYNQNKLEYRPVADNRPFNTDVQYSAHTPTYSRPQGTSYRPQTFSQDRYDFDQNPDHHQRPSHYRPNYHSTTEYNPYSLVTFSHIETTQRPDLFNRPRPQYSTNVNQKYPTTSSSFHSRPIIVNSDNSYGTNPRPVRPQVVKPVGAGITIYIDNKPRPKPPQLDDNFDTDDGYSSTSSDEENVPLFNRPNYQTPLLQKPATNYNRPQYPRPIIIDNTEQDNENDQTYNTPLQSDYGHFSSWTNKPDESFLTDDDNEDDNTYSIHKERPNNSHKKPTRHPNRPKPSHVNLNVASEYGTQHHGDISIVIDPDQRYKSTRRPTQSAPSSSRTTAKPIKHFYIGNVLYKYPQNQDAMKQYLSRTTNLAERTNEGDEIIKENYNNVWKPDMTEHKHFYGDDDSISSEGKTKNKQSSMQIKTNNSSAELIDTKILLKAEMKEDLEVASSNKRRVFVKAPSPGKAGGKINKNHVFFDVIPSENSPSRWAYYDEKPEESSDHIITTAAMPSIDLDPLASKELPRPIFPATLHKHHKNKNQNQ